MRVQLESLKATTDTKEVSFKIAYGLPLSEMLRWGLYISGAACFAAHTLASYSRADFHCPTSKPSSKMLRPECNCFQRGH